MKKTVEISLCNCIAHYWYQLT